MRRTASSTIASVLVLAGLGGGRSWAADVILGADAGDSISVQVNKKSSNAASHQIKFSAKDTGVDFTAGGGSTDDPLANGAAAVVFSATDCQCIIMDNPPVVSPGWTQAPASGPAVKYKWKDLATKSSAQVKEDKIKLKKKGGITYGLDATPQGEVEVQVTFGSSADTFCARFGAPAANNDTATKYKAKVFDTGTAACSAVPGFCGPCAPPGPTTTSTTTTTTTTVTSTTATTTTTTTTSTTTLGPAPPCTPVLPSPACDGDCGGPGVMCADPGGGCMCVPSGGPCGTVVGPPTCLGDCFVPGQACIDIGGTCACDEPGPPPMCGVGLPPPFCDGACGPGVMCADPGGGCMCVPTGGPCGAVSPFPVCLGDCPVGTSCRGVFPAAPPGCMCLP